MIVVKKHNAGSGRMVLALCDAELLGKTFGERGLQLDLSSDFYRGEEKTEAEVERLLKDTYIVNFVGRNAVRLGIKAGLIDERGVIRIMNVPHAQSMR